MVEATSESRSTKVSPWRAMRHSDLVALDDALHLLAKMDERRSQIIELRFFGGLTVEETAVVLKVAPDTVMRDSRLAKAWLARELSGGKRRHYAGDADFLSPAGQLTTIVSGATASSSVLTRKRWPSGETSYGQYPLTMGTSNRRCTAPTSKRDPFAVTSAAISMFHARKKISLPSRRHRALSPPAVEIRTLPPGPGNGTTYTSDRPDSFEFVHQPAAVRRKLAPGVEKRRLDEPKGLAIAEQGQDPEIDIPLGPGRHVKQELAVGGHTLRNLVGIIRKQHVLGACPAGRLLIQINASLVVR